MNIEIGTKVKGNWGAMHPTSEGKIVKIESNGVEILWDGEIEVDFVHLESIHEKGYRSANGSDIGIFIDEYDAHQKFKRTCGFLDPSFNSDNVTCLHIDNPTAIKVCSFEHCPMKK
jgi:hypothetical protein